MTQPVILVNFGGPRSLEEIEEFLIELLCDRDVIQPRLPSFLHRYLFRKIAKKRSKKIAADYAQIGGKSPIFEDTEQLASSLKKMLNAPVITFHRYLPKTHPVFFEEMKRFENQKCQVLPLFPQFSYATTGSVARFFSRHLPVEQFHSLLWIASYAEHPAFHACFAHHIDCFLKEQGLNNEELFFLFSAHGVPQSFICSGDPYERECLISYEKIASHFPQIPSQLSYQSRFGPEEWIQPYTEEVCQNVERWVEKGRTVVVIPLTFTSDHIETLFEIEELYLPVLREKGYEAVRCPAFSGQLYWIETLSTILKTSPHVAPRMLIRGDYSCKRFCKCSCRCNKRCAENPNI